MPEHLEFEQWVPFPLGRVFGFFSNPENLARIMPVSTATKVESVRLVAPESPASGQGDEKAAGAGTVIITSFRIFPLLPFRAQWIARIAELEWNHYFADVQEKGPFKTWHHRHEFAEETRPGNNGTRIRDIIDYEIGWGVLGAVADALFVRRQMKRMFEERQRRLPSLLA